MTTSNVVTRSKIKAGQFVILFCHGHELLIELKTQVCGGYGGVLNPPNPPSLRHCLIGLLRYYSTLGSKPYLSHWKLTRVCPNM